MADVTTAPVYFDFLLAQAFLTPQTLLATLDDANSGSAQSPAATLVFNLLGNLACTRVDGFLKRIYPGPFPITQQPTPANIQTAALLWFKALLFERHTDYVRQYGSVPRKEAMQFCEDMCDSKEWLSDLVGGAPPGNAGGIVTNDDQRMIANSSNGCRNSGDF